MMICGETKLNNGNVKILAEEVRKSEIKPIALFCALVFYIFAVLVVLNLTAGRINTLLCDFLSLLCMVFGVYFLYRCKVLSFRYVLFEDETSGEDKLSISRISGKNNELIQFEASLGDVSYSDDLKKAENELKYCVPFSKNERFSVTACVDDETYTVTFQPSDAFLEKLKMRIGCNEEK